MSKMFYTLISWFLIGVMIGIILEISTGEINVNIILELGFFYILYPFWSLFIFGMVNNSGSRQVYVNSTLIFGLLAVIYILTPIVVSHIVNRNRKREYMIPFTSKDFSLKYCHTCNIDVGLKIEEEQKLDVIQGKEIKYLAQNAYCNVCGTKICLEEIDRRNAKIAHDKYNELI